MYDFSLRNQLLALVAALTMSSGLAGAEENLRISPLVRAVRLASRSVVNIHTEKDVAASQDNRLFQQRHRKVSGMGTGLVVDHRGYIVTNYHVIDGVSSITVTFDDGEACNASVVSYDRREDLAIIRIEVERDLDVMPTGSSDDLMLAETVFAVGNAFGYEHTVTSGIISALHRNVEVDEHQSYRNLIQTDASINPGNSGGPLLNVEGDVIGINVAIRSGAQRIGFAIPIDDARRVIARLLSVERLRGHSHGIRATTTLRGTGLQVEQIAGDSPA
ncbi:MAG: S1C family serine protease, partial [Planctomycetaceae bacterium]